jgi:class 3 adenylate cyclase/ligand-binding sensor domain-containing protein
MRWTRLQGLAWDGMNSMIKDANGFLWFGSTRGGFCRFDGANFKQYFAEQNKAGTINSDKISSFLEDSLNNIWISTSKGLSRYDLRADTFTNFSASNNSGLAIMPMCSAKDEIFCMEPGRVITAFNIHTLTRRELLKLPNNINPVIGLHLNRAFFDRQTSSIWKLGLNKDTVVLEQIFLDGRTQKYFWPCFRKNIQHGYSTEQIKYCQKRNSIWLNSSDGLLEFSLNDKQFLKIDALNEFTNSKDYVRGVGIDIDPAGRIIFSTNSHGIVIYDPEERSVRQILSDPNLQQKAGDANLHIYCDRDNIVWTSNWLTSGIYEIIPFNSVIDMYAANPAKKDSLTNKSIRSIVPAANGEVWVGTNDGLNVFDSKTNKFNVIREKDLPGVNGKYVAPIFIDTVQGKAWIISSISEGPGDYDFYKMDIETRKCEQIIFRYGAQLFDKFSIPTYCIWPYKKGLLIADEHHGVFEVKENSLFADMVIPFKSYLPISRMVLADERSIFIQQSSSLPNYSFENKNGKWSKMSHPLDSLEWQSMFYNSKDQTYWVAFRYELVHYNKSFSKIKTYGREDGYKGTAMNMMTDDRGNLWFTTNLHQVNRLDSVLDIITNISENNGYQKQNLSWFTPFAKDDKGILYFGVFNYTYSDVNEIGGLNRIYPEKYSSAITSSVYLRSLTINQKPYLLSTSINELKELSLPYNQNTISIETGIIDLHANGRGHIRYKLKAEGQQESWQYGESNFTIRYEKLPPGEYELVLQASNEGKEFNSPEKTITITIYPPFWQTWWFRTIAVAALLLLLYGIYRWRTATLRRQKRILEQTVKERTAEVEEEKVEVERQKEKSDELLLNILPSEVANELKEKGYTTAKSFDEVTVLFSDIKGFTSVAEKLTAQELVKEINTYFSAFDNIILKYGLEKIKTIGDAYIAAGGLPEKNRATAQNVIEAAIAMQQIVEKLKYERESLGKPFFELRIGIHTGHVVAGVVGIKKFQYDIWGDTVNLAARMEQSGVPGKINISQQTYELVKGQFNCIHRGKIEAKNKGDIDMYFVE